MKNLRGILVAAISVATSFVFVACSKNLDPQYGVQPKPAVRAAPKVKDSLAVQTPPEIPAPTDNQAQIVIKKSALDKEFLLMGSIIVQQPVPSFSGLKSRVVAFKEINNRLYLLESTAGHEITNDLPENLVLTEFPIIKEDSQQITFDFNTGMSSIFVQGDWYSEDGDGTTYKYNLEHADVLHSFIQSAAFSSKSNTLVIDQVAQVNMKDDSGNDVTQPVEVKYYLSPYEPDPTFQPVLSEGMKKYGYFEVAPQLYPDGSSYIRVAHFQINKPIVYAISANTPENFREPIRQAILYWNQVLGKNVIQVVQLTDPKIVAPNPDYNIVQWVENDAAGFAYADAQMDPRSGQVLHAQVYLTSVFGDLGIIRGERDLRNNQPTTKVLPMLQGFAKSAMCRLPVADALKTIGATLDGQNLTEAQALKIAQDYVRETVAHEVGHTLGLRHNFAGSLAASYSLADRNSLYASYLNSGHTPAGVTTTSSIMDYELFEESAMTGDEISRGVAHLDYDIDAIRHLYNGQNFDKVPAFCTDSDLGKYLDCNEFDTGRSFVDYSLWQLQTNLQELPQSLIATYITQKVPLSMATLPKPVDELALNPVSAALSIMTDRFNLYKAFTATRAFIAVRTLFPFVTPFDQDQINKVEHDYLAKDFSSLGGVSAAFFPISDNFSQDTYNRFVQLLSLPQYTSGLQDGKPFSFSPAEKEIMETNVKLYLDELQQKLILLDLTALDGTAKPKDPSQASSSDSSASDTPAPASLAADDLSNQLLTVMTSRVDQYVFSTVGTPSAVQINVQADSGKIQTVTAKLPNFKYPFAIRLAAAKLLTKGRSKDLAWGLPERAKYTDQFTKLMDQALGATPDQVDPASLSHDAAEWLAQNAQILTALSGN